MAWVDFAICLCFGWFGIHKFREKKIGMGILYMFTAGLCCIGWWYDCFRYLMAAIKGERLIGEKPPVEYKQLADDEPLPVVASSNVMMSDGEVCHFFSPGTFVRTKNVVVGYSGGSRGTSIRVAKGVSFRVGASKAKPIRDNVQEKHPGYLTITSKRVLFAGSKGSFDKKLTALSSVTPHEDGITFQFGDKVYPILLSEPVYAYQILARVINDSEE